MTRDDTSGALWVSWKIVNGTTTNEDFAYLPGQDGVIRGTMQIPDETSSASFAINVSDDPWAEETEDFSVELEGSGYVIGSPSSADGSIADNEPSVYVVATDDVAKEDRKDPGEFTIHRTQNGGDLTVYYSFGGSANHGTVDANGNPTPTDADFTGGAPHGTGSYFKAVIPSGQLTVSVQVTPRNDHLIEGTESITLELAADQSAGVPPSYHFQAGGGQVGADIDLNDLRVTLDPIPPSGHPPTQAEINAVNALFPKLEFNDEGDRNAAEASLKNQLAANVQLEQTYINAKNNLGPEGDIRIDRILAQVIPPTFSIDGDHVLHVHRAHTSPIDPAVTSVRLVVYPEATPQMITQTPGPIFADLEPNFADGSTGRSFIPEAVGDSVVFVIIQYRDADDNIVRQDEFNLFVHVEEP